jgi:hypothetical protein
MTKICYLLALIFLVSCDSSSNQDTYKTEENENQSMVCTPNKERCNGDIKQSCNLLGQWEDVACPSKYSCLEIDGLTICQEIQVVEDMNMMVDQGGSQQMMDMNVVDQGGSQQMMDMNMIDMFVTMPPACIESISIGDACNPNLDCCARDSVCIADAEGSETGTCYRLCDAHYSPNGCQTRELCVPLNPNIDPQQSSPGFCLIGDDCEPGSENIACGDGRFTCVRSQNITLCVDLATIHIYSIKDIAEECDLQNTFCTSGLVCEYGICRASCNDHTQGTLNSCQPNEQCLDYTERTEGVNYHFCMDQCDLYTQDCANNEACVLVDSLNNGVVAQCVANTTNGTMLAGSECTMSDVNYWGDCTANHVCQASENGSNQCVSLCDTQNLDQCVGNQACVTGLFNGLDGVGICSGECDPFANNGLSNANCGIGEACSFFNVGQTSVSPETAIGRCEAFRVDVARAGEGCTVTDETTGASNCGPNMICAAIAQGAAPICIKFCQEGNASAGCDAGVVCRTGLFEGLDSIGLCIGN